jgi:hypothetical protein
VSRKEVREMIVQMEKSRTMKIAIIKNIARE